MLRRFFALLLILTFGLAACASEPDPTARMIAHPNVPGAEIEYFVRRPADHAGPLPTVVFIHGHQDGLSTPGGKAFVDWGMLDHMAGQGFSAVSVSLPGFGNSSGPRDFAGPIARMAVQAVIAELRQDGEAAPGAIVLHGVSLGAIVAGHVAALDSDIAGLVLISGLYDLPAFLSTPGTSEARDIRASALAQNIGGAAGLQERSLLRLADRINAQVLIMNGADDPRTDPLQARQFADAINAAGGNASFRLFAGQGHRIPVELRQAEIDRFITVILGE